MGPPKKLKRGGGFGGDTSEPKRERSPVVKVGVYKELDDEEKRRAAAGEEPMSLQEKDLIMRNYNRKMQGLPPLEAKDLTGPPITDKEKNFAGKGGYGAGGGKGKGKDKGKDYGKDYGKGKGYGKSRDW